MGQIKLLNEILQMKAQYFSERAHRAQDQLVESWRLMGLFTADVPGL